MLTMSFEALDLPSKAHDLHTKCDDDTCIVCLGGLSLCSVCGGAEAALPTDCPGRRMTGDELYAIQARLLDVRGSCFVTLKDGWPSGDVFPFRSGGHMEKLAELKATTDQS
jgi:hypothetical protein